MELYTGPYFIVLPQGHSVAESPEAGETGGKATMGETTASANARSPDIEPEETTTTQQEEFVYDSSDPDADGGVPLPREEKLV